MPCWPIPTSARATIASARPASRAPAAGGAGFNPENFADFSDILGDFFGFGGGPRRAGPTRGADLRFDLEITFEESFTGTETTIQIPREEHCDTCKGSGAAAGTSRKPARSAGARASCAISRASSSSRARAGNAAARARSFARRAPRAGAPGSSRASDVSPCKYPPASPTDSAFACTARASTAPSGGPTGDLYVVIHVKPHAVFQRDGDDLLSGSAACPIT